MFYTKRNLLFTIAVLFAVGLVGTSGLFAGETIKESGGVGNTDGDEPLRYNIERADTANDIVIPGNLDADGPT